MAKATRKVQDPAAAMAATVTGASDAPPPVASPPPEMATGDQVADPAQKADNGPTPPETGIAGMATAGEGAVAAASAPASPPEPDMSAYGPDNVQVTVIGPAKGRWRIGRHFTPEPTIIVANEITGAQAKALASDPELVCHWAEVSI
jgi:hypothetical protein